MADPELSDYLGKLSGALDSNNTDWVVTGDRFRSIPVKSTFEGTTYTVNDYAHNMASGNSLFIVVQNPSGSGANLGIEQVVFSGGDVGRVWIRSNNENISGGTTDIPRTVSIGSGSNATFTAVSNPSMTNGKIHVHETLTNGQNVLGGGDRGPGPSFVVRPGNNISARIKNVSSSQNDYSVRLTIIETTFSP